MTQHIDLGGHTKLLLRAVEITIQRETMLAWNVMNGMHYHNAIVWDNVRTSNIDSCFAYSLAS